jgi:ferredoxin-type protein NapH
MKNFRRFCLLVSFLLLPVTLNYFSPYLIIDGIINKVASGAFFVWAFMFLSSFLFGRAFCSYVCPYGGEQMVLDKVIEKPLKKVDWLKKLRLILGIIWIGAIIALLFVNKGFSRVDFLYLTEKFVSVDNWMKLVGYYVIVTGLLLLPLFMGKRASCHYLCPMSILNVAGTKIKNNLNLPSLRLSAKSNECKSCNKCSRSCPMSLDVMGMVKSGEMDSTECILCGECSKACSFGVIARGFRKKQHREREISNSLNN